jgi:hypothetical protein
MTHPNASVDKYIKELADRHFDPQSDDSQFHIDRLHVGLPSFQGIGWFHHHDYRHILRCPGDYADAKGLKRAPSTRQWCAKYKRIHDALMAAGLDVRGSSKRHDEIVYGILRISLTSQSDIVRACVPKQLADKLGTFLG